MEASESKISQDDWVKLSVVFAATIVLYGPVLAKLVRDWWHDPNYSHGFLIPPLAIFIIWKGRKRFCDAPVRPSNWGLLFAFGAAGLLFLGSLGAELFLTRISLVCMLAALVVFLFGWQWSRQMVFPLAVLLLMIPIPQIVFNQLAFPLQLTATHLSSSFLSGVGIPVLRTGNLIQLPNNVALEVVEACSGIRSLMALLALGVTYGYFFEPRKGVRWLLVVSTVPIAVIANGLRIAGTGVMTYLVDEVAAEGFFHLFSGWMVFLCALLLLVGTHKLIGLYWRGLRWGGAR